MPFSDLMISLSSVAHQLTASELLTAIRDIKPVVAISGGLLFWLCLVRALRWRRYNYIHRKYGAKWDNGRGSISAQEAQEITHLSLTYDMPWLIRQGVSFALFKTYGIPSISKLLAATKELKSTDTVSRRYADTEILIATFSLCPITGIIDPSINGKSAVGTTDPRGAIALARTNWLHSKYNISNDDFLYTLCLFALEPIYWSDRFGWRSMSPLEKHAYYVFWAEIGRRMDIKEIPDTLESLMEWSQGYERKHMIPAQSNRDVAKYTLDELLSAAPDAFGIKAFGERLAICLLDDITREAMMYEKQPWVLRVSVNGLLHTSAFVQKYFLLPRSSPYHVVETGPPSAPTGECPRLHPARYAARPWYRPQATTYPGYLIDKLLVKLNWYYEMPSAELKSSGYRIEEVGPIKWEQDGHEEVMRNAEKLLGCPVNGPWSLDGRKRRP